MAALTRSPRARWLVPVVMAAFIGGVALVPTLGAGAGPDLPAITPQQLIEKVEQARVETFSGTVELTANLGIPNLSALRNNAPDSSFNPMDLLSGVHDVDVAVDGPERQRMIQRGDLSENAVYRNGRDVWTWQSVGSKVSHTQLPADHADHPATNPGINGPAPTPPELAQHFLDNVTPTTQVSVTTPDYVAGRAVYELVLAPRAAESTVDHVGIAVDAANGMPLRVTVTAKDQTKPAIQLGFTSIDYSRPGGSFTFTAPPGASPATNPMQPEDQPRRRHVTRGAVGSGANHMVTVGSAPPRTASTSTVRGESWSSVVVVDNVNIPGQAGPLFRAATPVSGSWGSGYLLETNLINVLFVPPGRLVAGFVTPAALEAAVQP